MWAYISSLFYPKALQLQNSKNVTLAEDVTGLMSLINMEKIMTLPNDDIEGVTGLISLINIYGESSRLNQDYQLYYPSRSGKERCVFEPTYYVTSRIHVNGRGFPSHNLSRSIAFTFNGF